jgi:hypothetical protein
VSSASAHAFLSPFAALIMLQLLVLAAASRLPARIHQEADSSKAPAPAPGQLAVRPESVWRQPRILHRWDAGSPQCHQRQRILCAVPHYFETVLELSQHLDRFESSERGKSGMMIPAMSMGIFDRFLAILVTAE